jgi:TrwC relaxase
MLTISKPLSAGQAQSCHQTEFTAELQNDWSRHGVTAGEWQGRLVRQFRLVGAVSAEDFAKLSQGQNPQTGEQLVGQRAAYEYQDADGKTNKTMKHRAGWDATFSPPKSVSLTALVGDGDRVRDTQQDSAALDALQEQDRAKETPNAEDGVRTIARGYVESPENTLIVSPDNASSRELNTAVRQELKANGTIASEDHKFSVLVQRRDMTGADRSWASRGLPRSLPQGKLLMTTHLFDNECDRSDLGVLCAVQHELVAPVDHSAQRHQRIGNCGPRIQSPATNRLPCDRSGRSAQHLSGTRE